jgi:nucleotide sugar dehydrogenase
MVIMIKTNEPPQDNIIIIGLGYVGLTFALHLTNLGKIVYGVDNNHLLCEDLKRGKSEIIDYGLKEMLVEAIQNETLLINVENKNLSERNIYVVTVGTPFESNNSSSNQIDEVRNFLIEAIRDEDLIILRSTVKIGTTLKLYEDLSVATGKVFYMAMCPERTIEGNAINELRDLPQIISGVNSRSLQKVDEFFKSIGTETVHVESTNSAEFIKLISNTYRDLNFAFANEIAIIGSAYGINVWNAINSANYKYPRNDIKLPGLTGGPCLEKDPKILASSANERGLNAELSLTGRKVNLSLPSFSMDKIINHSSFLAIPRDKYLILGLAFKGKPANKDARGSLAFLIADVIRSKFPFATIVAWDPFISYDPNISLSQNFILDLSSADVIFLQNNNLALVEQIKAHGKKSIKRHAIVYDFWNTLSSNDLPADAHLIGFGNYN